MYLPRPANGHLDLHYRMYTGARLFRAHARRAQPQRISNSVVTIIEPAEVLPER